MKTSIRVEGYITHISETRETSNGDFSTLFTIATNLHSSATRAKKGSIYTNFAFYGDDPKYSDNWSIGDLVTVTGRLGVSRVKGIPFRMIAETIESI